MSSGTVDADPRTPAADTTEARPKVFPLGTPRGAGALIGWAKGAKPAGNWSETSVDAARPFGLTRADGRPFDGQDSGFLDAMSGNRIWLFTEDHLVVGREGSGPGGAVSSPDGGVALAFGLDPENRLALAYYKKMSHPETTDPGQMAGRLVRLVHVSPAGRAGSANEESSEMKDLNPPAAANPTSAPVEPQANAAALPSEVPSVTEPIALEPASPPFSPAVASTAAVEVGKSNGLAANASPIGRGLARLGGGLGRAIGGGSAPAKRAPTGMHASIRRHLRFAIAAIVLLAGGIGGWAATTELSGAVIAMGQLVVDSNVKKIQHPFGGVVAELNVRDGDRVETGEVLVRLDGTEANANLAIVTKALDELFARQARGNALRDGAASISFPPDLLVRKADPDVAALMEGEERLFNTLLATSNGQKAQLKEQVAQLEEQVRGMEKQLEAKAKEIDWNSQELVGIHELWEKKLIDFARVTTAERDGARLEGEHGMLLSSIAEAKGKIAEIELRILQVDEDLRTEMGKELADIRSKIAELVEKKVAAEDQLQRLDIRAPQGGLIHELAIHTVGGVIRPGDTIMGVVPDSDALTAEVKVPPNEIDLLYPGQSAVLRFLTFHQQTTPELNAKLSVVSADVTTDPKTGANYYTARVSVSEEEIARLGGAKLMAGMPVEVFVQTNPRTVISYLVRPLSDQVERAFRER